MLQIVKTPDEFQVNTKDRSQYWENFTSYTLDYIKKSKALIRNMAFLWKFSVNQSDYFIQFTDHVIVEGDLVSSLLHFKKNWFNNLWLWANNVDSSLTGRLYKTKNLPELIQFFDIFGSYLPLNKVLTFYRQFRFSREAGYTPQKLPIFDNYNFTADNPPADVTTSLYFIGGNYLQDVYKDRKGYFWASTPKEGDFIMIDFKKVVWINRILIETGSHLYEDIIPSASLSVVLADGPKPGCYRSNYIKIADFAGPTLEVKGSKIFFKPISCIKIAVTPVAFKDLQSWTIIKTIAVFQKL